MIPGSIQKRLKERANEGRLRALSIREPGVDFFTNDYLGIAQSLEHKELIEKIVKEREITQAGSTGSRLLSGNSKYAEELESSIAEFHNAETALIFNSGYDANIGLFSSVPTRHDTVVYDSQVHASIRDGIRLSSARNFSFKHNDVEDLKKKIAAATGEVYIAVESIYSMDGSIAPLLEIEQISKQHQAQLIVDEAHSIGVMGKYGEGLATRIEAFARVYTYGKALGAHGAAIVGSNQLKSFLINFSRSFIYSTALAQHSLVAIESGYHLIKSANKNRQKLSELSEYVAQILNLKHSFRTAIIALAIPGNQKCRAACKILEDEGIITSAILSPTVPKGDECLRICLHSYNTENELKRLGDVLKANNFI